MEGLFVFHLFSFRFNFMYEFVRNMCTTKSHVFYVLFVFSLFFSLIVKRTTDVFYLKILP